MTSACPGRESRLSSAYWKGAHCRRNGHGGVQSVMCPLVPLPQDPPQLVDPVYNGRGTAEQWIKEGKYALNWTRLSCHRFVANQVGL